MKPIEFPESNVTYADEQPEYLPLPALKASTPDGTVVTCWELTEEDKKRIAETGQVWLSVMTFHSPLQPLFLTTDKDEVIIQG